VRIGPKNGGKFLYRIAERVRLRKSQHQRQKYRITTAFGNHSQHSLLVFNFDFDRISVEHLFQKLIESWSFSQSNRTHDFIIFPLFKCHFYLIVKLCILSEILNTVSGLFGKEKRFVSEWLMKWNVYVLESKSES